MSSANDTTTSSASSSSSSSSSVITISSSPVTSSSSSSSSSSSTPPSSSSSSTSSSIPLSSSAPPSSSQPPPSSVTTRFSSSSIPTSVVIVPSIVQSTSVGTSDGELYTTTVILGTTTIAIGPTTTPSAGHKSSKTGAIVGGVVGGIAGLLLLLLALLLFRRYQRRSVEKLVFDGNFDPVHAVHHGHPNPNLTLDDQDDGMGGRLGTGVGGVISPFNYVPESGPGSVARRPEMQQYHPQQAHGMYPTQPYPPTISSPSSDGGSGSGDRSQSGSYYMNMSVQDPHYMQQPNMAVYPQPGAHVGRGPSLSSSHQGTNSSSGPTSSFAATSAKEREAFGSRPLSLQVQPGPGLGLANPDAEASGSNGAVSGATGLDRESYLRNGPAPIVHRDAGRVAPEEEEGGDEQVREEIPPTYDSLPADERR